MPPITDPPGTYGHSTAAAVLIYKEKNSIVRPVQPLDNIVGRMTITQIDDDLVRGVKPIPPPPPPPIVSNAGVQIGPLGNRGRFVDEYYNKCGLETIGPGQIRTGGLRHYSTLEELIDVLQARSEFHQVIVNHGNRVKGLILPFAKGSPFDGTGNVVGVLSILAEIVRNRAILTPLVSGLMRPQP